MLERPEALLLWLAAAAIIIWLLRTQYFPGRANRLPKILLGMSRLLIAALLVIAIAGPYIEDELFGEGRVELALLIDESASMSSYDTGSEELIEELRVLAPLEITRFGTQTSSPIGAQALSALRRGGTITLLTDGQVTDGPTLRSVASYARTRNASINAIVLKETGFDASVSISAPEKTVAGVDQEITVEIERSSDRAVDLRIVIDDETVHESRTSDPSITVTRSFPVGEHVVRAVIGDDLIQGNNEYQVTISSVPKPRVLYLSRESSALEQLLGPLYSVDHRSSLPGNLSEYYAIFVNDLPLQEGLESRRLAEYVNSGGGLVVSGGQDSFDNGGYKDSSFEKLLPVRVGAGERSQGGANIVIAIDLSGSTRGSVRLVDGEWVAAGDEQQSLEKALAISVLSELNPSNKVGVLGFIYGSPSQPCAPDGLCVIRPLSLLGNEKQDAIDRISRVDVTGGTSMYGGMRGAWTMLESEAGSKNVIFISDGDSTAMDYDLATNVAEKISAASGRVYAVQVGDSVEGGEFLKGLARAGRGAYFQASKANRLALLFGEPSSIEEGDSFSIVVVNQYHFITDDPSVRDLSAVLYGYNQVAPKPGASVLVASAGGDPVLTTWYSGVGRVAAITGYNGPDLGELLSGNNSKLITRTTNWAIGDPERLDPIEVSVPDAYVGERVPIRVRADRVPRLENLSFSPEGLDTYVAYREHSSPGVYSAAGRRYAINHPAELSAVGVSPELVEAVESTGGEWFTSTQADDIYEHAKRQQLLVSQERVSLSWLFILAALSLFLVEVLVRRVRAMRGR